MYYDIITRIYYLHIRFDRVNFIISNYNFVISEIILIRILL